MTDDRLLDAPCFFRRQQQQQQQSKNVDELKNTYIAPRLLGLETAGGTLRAIF